MNFKRVDVPDHLIERFNDEYFEALVSMSITISEEHADDEEAIWEAMAVVHSHMLSGKLVDNPPHTGQENELSEINIGGNGIPLPPFFLRSNKMQAPPGYKEVDVPPHLMKLFNETFQHDFGHCRLFLRDSKGKYSDKDIWAVMVDSMDRGIMDEDEDLLDEDYVPRKKITWH